MQKYSTSFWISLLVVTAYLFGVSAQAGVIYVKPAGDDTSGDGTSWATAYASLNKAFETATANDIIFLMQGTYNPVSNLENTSNPVNVRIEGGYTGVADERVIDPENTIFDYGNSSTRVLSTKYGSGLVFSGITFRNISLDGYGAFAQIPVGGNFTLEDCVVNNIHQTNTKSVRSVFRFTGTATLTINRCRIVDCSGDDSGVIARNSGTGTVILSNSVIRGTTKKPFILGANINATITNCTFINNPQGAISGATANTTITNCIFFDSPLSGGDGGNLSYSYLRSGDTSGSFTKEENVSYDTAGEVFADEVDFLPAASFAGIGKGSQAVIAAVGSMDCARNPRVNGKLDIGAYENQQKVTVSVNNSKVTISPSGTNNAWYREDLEFSLQAAEGFTISSVEAGGSALTPVSGIYTLPTVTENVEVAVVTEAVSKEITVNATNVAIVSPTLTDGKFTTTASSEDIAFTVEDGYENPTVTVDGVDYVLGAPVNDVYTISLTGITSDKTVVVTATQKPGSSLTDKDADKVAVRYADGRLLVDNAKVGSRIQLFNLAGICVWEEAVSSSSAILDCPLKAGVYLLKTGEAIQKVLIK
ncbi:MAG: right-handed parallel beta-helix repeat-containing protein [Dysgonamonadaceae bacterium]